MAPSLLTRAIAVLLCFLWLGTSIKAEPRTLRLGEMELAFDAGRWRAESVSENAVNMQPIGAIVRAPDPVLVSRAASDGIDNCQALARRQLSDSFYEEATVNAIEVAGVTAIRLVAHTRCRNAMPRGVAICAQYRGSG